MKILKGLCTPTQTNLLVQLARALLSCVEEKALLLADGMAAALQQACVL